MGMRIATFNLKDFFEPRDANEGKITEAKIANVAENMKRANADVLALQEVGSEAMVMRLATHEAKELGYGAPVFGTPDRRGIRCAVLSRYPILWSQIHTQKALTFPRFVTDDPEPFAGRIPLRRGVVHVRVDAPKIGEVDVLTMHFKSTMGVVLRNGAGEELSDPTPRGTGEAALRSFVQRAAEALYVRGLVDEVFRALPDHAVCVLGDLNDTTDSVPVRILLGIRQEGHGRLRSCVERAQERSRFSCFHAGGQTLIDHILVSDRLFDMLGEMTIQNETLRYHGPFAEAVGLTPDSDHALCVASFG